MAGMARPGLGDLHGRLADGDSHDLQDVGQGKCSTDPAVLPSRGNPPPRFLDRRRSTSGTLMGQACILAVLLLDAGIWARNGPAILLSNVVASGLVESDAHIDEESCSCLGHREIGEVRALPFIIRIMPTQSLSVYLRRNVNSKSRCSSHAEVFVWGLGGLGSLGFEVVDLAQRAYPTGGLMYSEIQNTHRVRLKHHRSKRGTE